MTLIIQAINHRSIGFKKWATFHLWEKWNIFIGHGLTISLGYINKNVNSLSSSRIINCWVDAFTQQKNHNNENLSNCTLFIFMFFLRLCNRKTKSWRWLLFGNCNLSKVKRSNLKSQRVSQSLTRKFIVTEELLMYAMIFKHFGQHISQRCPDADILLALFTLSCVV